MNKNTNQILFAWKGIDELGERIQGEDYSTKSYHLIESLKLKKIYVTKIRRQYINIHFFRIDKISIKQVIDFTQELALLLQAGIELNDALMIIIAESTHTKFKLLITLIQQQIEQGDSLSQALKQHSHYFDNVYLSMIVAGEASGTLAYMLKKLSHYQQTQAIIRQKISKALFYPLAIAVIAIMITCGLLLFVVPQFQEVFNSLGAKLPILTQVVINFSENIHHYGIQSMLIIVVLSFLLRFGIKKNNYMKYKIQRLLLCTPGIKQLLHMGNLMRTTHIIYTLMQSGLPLVKSLQLSQASLSILYFKEKMKQMIKLIENGHSFQQALKINPLFNSRCYQMLSIAENSGDLLPMLKMIAEQSEHQLDQLLDKMGKLIEPILMVLLALMIGLLIIAMYLPIFKLGTVI